MLCTVTTIKRFYPPPPLPRSKSSLKLVCNVNIVYGNLKSENSQDYAQKPQRNFMFMNMASNLIYHFLFCLPRCFTYCFLYNVCFRYYRSSPFFSVLTATVPAFTPSINYQLFFWFCATLAFLPRCLFFPSNFLFRIQPSVFHISVYCQIFPRFFVLIPI